jgi:cell division septation protein DedD
VAIYKNRPEADILAKELVAKGYPAFVMDPAKGAPAGIYRVRIGKYRNRKDAEDIAARLKTAEQFDPWIAR